MPELPEVETFRMFIEKTSLHKQIDAVKINAPKMIEGCTEIQLKKTLIGNSFDSTRRHGKFLFVHLRTGNSLMLHFGLTGDLHFVQPDEDEPVRFVMHCHFSDDTSLYFSDTRKLGKIAMVKDVDAFISERGYGRDALLISEPEFTDLVKQKKKAIKTVLMDQQVVAGVGNEFSDEILFQTRIHPTAPAVDLKGAQLKNIYRKMVAILEDSVKHQADRNTLEHYFFLENRKAGLPCPRCRTETESLTIGGRSAYFCPRCQRQTS